MARALNRKKSNRRDGGFSLVEVAMSLAIVGFACVAMLGVIPMGLTSFHRAQGNTIEADIVQNLTNDILLANFSNLYTYNNVTYYYDNEGSPLGNSGTSASVPTNTVYKATVTLQGVGSSAPSGGSSYVYAPAGLTDNGVATSITPSTSSSYSTSGSNTSACNVLIKISSVSNPSQPDSFPVIVPNNNL
jgi:uncharacterized protein (TIGR02598 family)